MERERGKKIYSYFAHPPWRRTYCQIKTPCSIQLFTREELAEKEEAPKGRVDFNTLSWYDETDTYTHIDTHTHSFHLYRRWAASSLAPLTGCCFFHALSLPMGLIFCPRWQAMFCLSISSYAKCNTFALCLKRAKRSEQRGSRGEREKSAIKNRQLKHSRRVFFFVCRSPLALGRVN